MPLIEYRAALPGDLSDLLPLIQEFYVHFEFPWNEERKSALLAQLLDDPGLGRVWVATVDDRIAGYALLPFYFSIEFDGRAALLDEFFVGVQDRGNGTGRRLLEAVVDNLAAEKIVAIRLEVDRRHPEASALYEQLGFRLDGRDLWTRRLAAGARRSAVSVPPA